jgi:hypothetical protein
MNWMALVALHATLTFGVLLLVAVVKLVIWLATRQRKEGL